MAHNILEQDTICYTRSGGVPWHGIGIPIGDNLSPEKVLVTAKLNWKVETQPLSIPKGFVKHDDHRMLVRIGNKGEQNRILDIVGTRFKPVQNKDVFEVFTKFVKAGKMKMETAGSLRNGKYVWALAKTTEAFSLAGKDEIRGYLLLVSPHQSGWCLSARLTPTRVVCWNTMSYALDNEGLSGMWKMRHSRNFDEVAKEEMEQTLGLVHTLMDDFKKQAKFLTSVKFNEATTVEYLCRAFDPQLATKLMEEKKMPKTFLAVNDMEDVHGRNRFRRVIRLATEDPEKFNPGYNLKSAKGTAWGAFNIVTGAYDHVLGHKAETRMLKSALGSNIGRKQKALDLALEMAKAA